MREAQLTCSQPRTIAELSAGTTLEAGSVICMGTPPPIGRTKDVDHWLHDGDVCRCSIEGIGASDLPSLAFSLVQLKAQARSSTLSKPKREPNCSLLALLLHQASPTTTSDLVCKYPSSPMLEMAPWSLLTASMTDTEQFATDLPVGT